MSLERQAKPQEKSLPFLLSCYPGWALPYLGPPASFPTSRTSPPFPLLPPETSGSEGLRQVSPARCPLPSVLAGVEPQGQQGPKERKSVPMLCSLPPLGLLEWPPTAPGPWAMTGMHPTLLPTGGRPRCSRAWTPSLPSRLPSPHLHPAPSGRLPMLPPACVRGHRPGSTEGAPSALAAGLPKGSMSPEGRHTASGWPSEPSTVSGS